MQRTGGKENDALEPNDNADGVVEHLHGHLLGVRRKSSAENGLLKLWMTTGGQDFLYLREKLGVQHPIRLIEDQMADTGRISRILNVYGTTHLLSSRPPDLRDATRRNGVLMMMSSMLYFRDVQTDKQFALLTNVISGRFIRQRARSGLAEEHDTPFTALGKFQTLVVDLVCQFSRRSNDDGSDSRTGVTIGTG